MVVNGQLVAGTRQALWEFGPETKVPGMETVVRKEAGGWNCAFPRQCKGPFGTPLPLNSGLSSTGMCLQAFVEAFFYLAQRKFKTLPLHEQVASLIDLCEYHLSLLDEKRLVCGRSCPSGGGPPDSSTPPDTAPSDQLVEGNPPVLHKQRPQGDPSQARSVLAAARCCR